MKRTVVSVRGVTAPPARPTVLGGVWLASVVTVPVALLVGALYLIGWLL